MLLILQVIGVTLSFILGVAGLHILLNSRDIMQRYEREYKPTKKSKLRDRLSAPDEGIRKMHVILSPLMIAVSLGAMLNIAYYW